MDIILFIICWFLCSTISILLGIICDLIKHGTWQIKREDTGMWIAYILLGPVLLFVIISILWADKKEKDKKKAIDKNKIIFEIKVKKIS